MENRRWTNTFSLICVLCLPYASGPPIPLGGTFFPSKSMDALIKEGSSKLTRIDKNGEMMLHDLIRAKNAGDVKKLLEPGRGAVPSFYGINVANGSGYTPMHLAVLAESEEIVDELIKVGAELNWKTAEREGGDAPLHTAAEKGSHAILEKLLAAGAEANAKNGRGYTAAHLGAKRGFAKIVQILSRYEADVDDGSPGRTALHEAVLNGHGEVARELLRMGADKDAAGYDLYIRTPVQMAVEKLNVEMVRLLLDSGADPNKRVDVSGRSAVFFLARDLKPLPPPPPSSSSSSSSREAEGKGSERERESEEKMKMKEILDLLSRYDADVAFENKEGYNVLGYSVAKDFAVTFEILMEKIREEVASGVPGVWTKVLEAEGKKGDLERGSRDLPPDTNGKNALDLSLDATPVNVSVAFPLIRLEAYRRRSRFRMDARGARNLLNGCFLNNDLDAVMAGTKGKTFGQFWDAALEYFWNWRKGKGETSDPLSRYARYKENDVYVFYLAAKQYYPHYRRTFCTGGDGAEEVAEFENAAIAPYRAKVEYYEKRFSFQLTPPVRRLDLEEKFVLLCIVMRELRYEFQDAESAIMKVIESA